MRDALDDLKRRSKWRDKSLARAEFSFVFANLHFPSKQIGNNPN